MNPEIVDLYERCSQGYWIGVNSSGDLRSLPDALQPPVWSCRFWKGILPGRKLRPKMMPA